MNKAELTATKSALTQVLARLPEPKCANCEHASHNGICSLFDEVPPAEIQSAGCDEWAFDGVPF